MEIAAENILFEILKIVLTVGLSAIVVGIWLQRWKYREDFIDERIDDLIEEVEAASNLACLYWKASPGNSEVESSTVNEFRDQEAELISKQMRIATLRSSVADFLAPKGGVDLISQEGALFRALTGGEFGSTTRTCDATRFKDIRGTAALYVGELRKARRARLDAGVFTRLLH